MFNKAKLNFVIDALMFLCMMVMLGIGFAVKYILPHGKERWADYGGGVDLFLFDMERHQWGNIHYYLGLVLLGLLFLHIVLHWDAVLCLYRRLIGSRNWRIAIASLFVVVNTCFVVTPFLITPEVRKNELRSGRQRISPESLSMKPAPRSVLRSSEERGSMDSQTEDIDKAVDRPVTGLQQSGEIDHDHQRTLEIRGYMTLAGVSEEFDVPIAHLEEKLGIAKSLHRRDKLGWLRRQYGFRMSDLDKIIRQYHQSVR